MGKARALMLQEPIVTGNTKAAVKAAGGGSSDLWTVPPASLHYDPRDNVRPLDQERVRHIADLIKANGFDRKKPIGCIVKKVDGEDRIYVYEGQHRYHATILAIAEGADIERLPIIIDEAKSVSRANLIIAGVTNNDGEKLTPLELATAVVELERLDVDRATICRRLDISDQTVRDVLLLANAPAELHELVRSKTVSSTLAIEEIRTHGPARALERIVSAASKAKSSGKSKVTKKALAKPTGGKIGSAQAKQLLQALQAVLHDPVFGKLSPSTIAAVHTALTPLSDMLDALPVKKAPARQTPKAGRIETVDRPNADYPVTPPDADGNVSPIEIFAPHNEPDECPHADIRIAQFAPGRWVSATTIHVGTERRSSPLKAPPAAPARVWSTRAEAIAAGIYEIGAYIDDRARTQPSEWASINRWMERLMTDPEVDKHYLRLLLTAKPRKGTPLHTAAAWTFPVNAAQARLNGKGGAQ